MHYCRFMPLVLATLILTWGPVFIVACSDQKSVNPPEASPPETSVNSKGSAKGDRAALVALYEATDGENWENSANWGSEAPLEEWYGVITDGGRVVRLILSENQLSGPIPPALGQLQNLQYLILRANQLSGAIPPALGQLQNLQYLELDINDLSGTIPPELGQLQNLQSLDLGENQLSGTIPPELGQLQNLTRLSLAGNELSGCIPVSFQAIQDHDLDGLGLPYCE